MKRPIAELLLMTLKPGTEAERAQSEHAAWQILRRKQGYVTHRIYLHTAQPLQRLVYSEWESKKAVDGARQYLQGTPLMRQARASLAAAPQRQIMEFVGPITSTKGLDLPDGAIGALASEQTSDVAAWQTGAEQRWKILAHQAGHLTHVIWRSLDEGGTVGSFSHWSSAAAFQAALAQATASQGESAVAYEQYQLVRD